MDPKTLAAFRASGETDVNKFLAKQGTADTPPGIPAGSYAGGAGFQGTTNTERGVDDNPTGSAFLGRIHQGLSALSGIPSAIGTAVGNFFGGASAAPPNVLIGSRTQDLEGDLNDLQQRSSQGGDPTRTFQGPQLAATAPTAAAIPALVAGSSYSARVAAQNEAVSPTNPNEFLTPSEKAKQAAAAAPADSSGVDPGAPKVVGPGGTFRYVNPDDEAKRQAFLKRTAAK